MEVIKSLKRLATLTGWRQFFQILSKREKNIFLLFFLLFLSSFSFLSISFYLANTEIQPTEGGIFIEGVIGQPRFINPVYALLSDDIDPDLTQLIFSGLMKYDSKGKIIPDLVKSYQVLDEGKTWEIELKENLFWSDNHPLTIDDILFTIETIQNRDIESPLWSAWLGVKTEKISDFKIRFKLEKPSSVFLENLTLKIIPKHIWKNISTENFPFSFFNLKPVGSGPYQLKDLIKDKKEGKTISINLIRNPNYHGKTPYIPKITFQFFKREEDLLFAIKNDKLNGATLPHWPVNLPNLTSWTLPRYFVVFFNSENKALAEKEVRQALNYGTDKKEIIDEILGGQGKVVDSPILSEIYGFKEPTKIYQFDLEKGKSLLEKAGFFEKENGLREKVIKKEPAFQLKSDLSLGSQGKEVQELQRCLARDKEIYPTGEISGYFGPQTRKAVIRFQEKYWEDILKPFGLTKGTGEVKKKTRNKLNEHCFKKTEEIIPLKFSLTTVNQPRLIETANLLTNQWQKLGAEIEIKTYDISDLEKEVIQPRNYEALLFGQVLGIIPDPFPFWHSLQKRRPGLNLAFYENEKVDKILETARENLNEEERKKLLEEFQEILIEDSPVVFLYNPNYLYFLSKEIKGVKPGIIADSSQRFAEIENWYIKTKRVWELKK